MFDAFSVENLFLNSETWGSASLHPRLYPLALSARQKDGHLRLSGFAQFARNVDKGALESLAAALYTGARAAWTAATRRRFAKRHRDVAPPKKTNLRGYSLVIEYTENRCEKT